MQVCKVDNRWICTLGYQPRCRIIPEFRFRHRVRIRMVGNAPVHLAFRYCQGVKRINNAFARIMHLIVQVLIRSSPPEIKWKINPVIRTCALDRRVERAECLLIRGYICIQICRSHVVPNLVVDLITQNPVGNLRIIWIMILAAVTIRQKREDRTRCLKSFLCLRVKHIIIGARRFRSSRMNQFRVRVIPVI